MAKGLHKAARGIDPIGQEPYEMPVLVMVFGCKCVQHKRCVTQEMKLFSPALACAK
jgi:hypothetical protein